MREWINLFEARSYPLADHETDGWYGNMTYREAGAKMVMMSPDDYLSRVRPLVIDEISRDNIDDLKDHIESGRVLDPLVIYANGKEDGRHRANAAKELGIDEVPVIIYPSQIDESTCEVGLIPNFVQQVRDAYAPDFAGSCEGAVGDLMELLQSAGIEAKEVEGGYDQPMAWGDGESHPWTPHWWVVCGDMILDPTREQFGSHDLVTSIDDPAYLKVRVGIEESAGEIGTFYHGTSSVFLDDIKQHGLRHDPGQRVFDGYSTSKGGVYLAVDESNARTYARGAVKKFGGENVIFVIEARWSDLHMDEDILYHAIEDSMQDAETAKDMADIVMQSYGFKIMREQMVRLCKLIEKGREKDDSRVSDLLTVLVNAIPAQAINPMDEPDYQAHYLGTIGWQGSPKIVGIVND